MHRFISALLLCSLAATALAQANAAAHTTEQGEAQIKHAEQARSAAQAQKPAAASRFEDIGSGSIKDTQTGLIWAQTDNGSGIEWKDATRYCADYNGRLPTVEELQGIFDKTGALSVSCGEFTCKVSPLFWLTNGWFWSVEQNGPAEAWVVHLDEGHRSSSPVVFPDRERALCVRRS